MTRGTVPMVEPKLTLLSPEALAKAGYDCPPFQLPSAQALPATRRIKRKGQPRQQPRELREARRQMVYHWF